MDEGRGIVDEGEAAVRELVRAGAAVSVLVSSLIASGLERATPGYKSLGDLVRQLGSRCADRTGAETALASMRGKAAQGIAVLQNALDALRAIEAAATAATTRPTPAKPARRQTRPRAKRASSR